MPKIIPKLNLNKTPQLVDNNSLIFAKNIKIGKDATIRRDDGYKNISLSTSDLYLLLWKHSDNFVKELLYRNADDIYDIVEYNIIKVIPYNTMFILLLKLKVDNIIVSYNELTKEYTYHSCNWHYSGGDIDGNIIINLRNELLLTIAESNTKVNVPIKTINLNKSSIRDDESIYTQSPKLTFINLNLVGTYSKSIPNGVYQFFIRYKISKNNYTNWYPASTELFAGNNSILATHQGTIKVMDPTRDSDESFILAVEVVEDSNLYKEFQLGFIISHDDEVYARSYKHYSINTTSIYFDYDTEFIKELNVTDLLEATYNVYNVKHITNFKNKQYIAGYKETNFNIDPDTIDSLTKNCDILIQADSSYSRTTIEAVTDELFDVSYESKNSKTYINKLNDTSINLFIKDKLSNGIDYYNRLSLVCKFLDQIAAGLEWLPKKDKGVGFISSTFLGFIVRVTLSRTDEVSGKETWTIGGKQWDDIRDLYNVLPKKINITDNRFSDDHYTTVYDIPILIKRYEISSTGVKTLIEYSGQLTLIPTFKNNTLKTISSKVYGASLLPYQTYEFYAHFVTKYGEVINGIFLDKICLDENQLIHINSEYVNFDYAAHVANVKHKYVFYPIFESIETNEDYPIFFITVKHIAKKYTDIVNVESYGTGGSADYVIGDILDYNLRLSGNYNELTEVLYDRGQKITTTGKYYRSSDSSNLITFGSSGKIISEYRDQWDLDNNGYILEQFTNKADNNLIRCTGFMKSCHQILNSNLNLEGYLSKVYCLNNCLDTYYSGTDKYVKRYTLDDKFTLDYEAYTKEFPYYEKIAEVYSRYNLNYLALQDSTDFLPKTKTEEKKVGSTTETIKVVIMTKDSINLTDVYKLPNMYKTYTRPLYSVNNLNDAIDTFTNTIRSSALIADESSINRFIFKPTDYYNVPSDKGIITNLAAVGNAILVHTQDSLYKFVGNNSLSANGGENIQLKESEVFDTGITEVFGSQFGFGGLADKRHSLIVEAGYVFYDRDSNIIYMYSGEGQVAPISDSIEKLMLYKPTDIFISNDYYNDRLFFSIKYNDNDALTLSYNLKLAAFTSIHDVIYDTSFNTKTKCYFIKDNQIYVSTNETHLIPEALINFSNKYPGIVYSKNNTNPACVVDVIYNSDYDAIKTLNAVSWICSKVFDFYDAQSNHIRVAEEYLDTTYAGDEIQIYTDHTLTDKILLSPRSNDQSLMRTVYTGPDSPTTIDDDDSNSNQRLPDGSDINIPGFNPGNQVSLTQKYVNEESYQLPRFNLGFWTLNYFRNVINNAHNQDNYGLDDTLIYGKYIVVRFIFHPNNDFKLENLSLNLQYNR